MSSVARFCSPGTTEQLQECGESRCLLIPSQTLRFPASEPKGRDLRRGRKFRTGMSVCDPLPVSDGTLLLPSLFLEDLSFL